MATATKTTRKPKPRPADVCRLTLTIRGEMYAVRPIPRDDPDDLAAFRLRKADGAAYDVHQSALTGNHCECGDFTFRREDRDPAGCKHIRALVALGLFS